MGRTRPYLIVGAPGWVTLDAFAHGLDLAGRSHVWGQHGAVDLDAIDPAAIVIDGMRGGGLATVRQAEARGIPCVVIDNGFLNRVHTAKDHDTGHFYVGLGGLGWTPPRIPGVERWRRLGIAIGTRLDAKDGPAVILGQVPGDASHGHSVPRLTSAYDRIARELRAGGIDRIVYRPHPLGWTMAPEGCEQSEPQCRSLAEAIAEARFVVSLNSNSGLDAIMSGIPAAAVLPSHYRPLAYQWPVNPRAIRRPDPDQVEAWCARLSWAQWTLAEIRAGETLRFLIEEGLAP